jgi:hypothetical protein
MTKLPLILHYNCVTINRNKVYTVLHNYSKYKILYQFSEFLSSSINDKI